MPVVLDASAYLAYVLDEPGAARVEEIMINDRAIMSAVNAAEVITKMVDSVAELERLTNLPGDVDLEPFTGNDAWYAAVLRLHTRSYGLSLGDRACLALGYRLRLPVLTADRVWADLDPADTRVEVQLIR